MQRAADIPSRRRISIRARMQHQRRSAGLSRLKNNLAIIFRFDLPRPAHIHLLHRRRRLRRWRDDHRLQLLSQLPGFCNLIALLLDLCLHLRIDHVAPFAQRIILGGRLANPPGRRQLHPHQPALHVAIERLRLAIELLEHRISRLPAQRNRSCQNRRRENDRKLPSHHQNRPECTVTCKLSSRSWRICHC